MQKNPFLISNIIIFTFCVILYGCSESNGSNKDMELLENENSSNALPKVYIIKEITPENLLKIYNALGREASGKVAIKLHMGEPGGNNYLKPELVGAFSTSVNGTFVDANTAYGGRRSSAENHLKVAQEHGFTALCPVDILDADGEIELPVKNGKHLKTVRVGSHLKDYDFAVILSHFKGHAMGGFGGALKNISIGMASVSGKCLIHTAGKSSTNAFQNTPQDDFLESMAEGTEGIINHYGNNILYINVMNNLSVDCDCSSNPAKPEISDIGILASLDPVALDRACVDQIYTINEEQKKHLIERIESRNGTHILDYAEKIGLGSQKYELIILE